LIWYRAAKQSTTALSVSAPSGIAQLRKSSDQDTEHPESMNLDEFIFQENISTPAGMSPSPELKEKAAPKPISNAVTSAIPIKTRKESAPISIPQSVPVQPHGLRNQDEFNYVQRHIRKTSIDERPVRALIFCFFLPHRQHA
jgi:GATA-binding protein, other eukaryote